MGDSERGFASFAGIGAVTAVPALAMALGSTAVSAGQPSEQLQARLQHFSAGLLIGAVVTDIFPILKARIVAAAGPGGQEQVQWPSALAGAAGFGLALLMMYGVKNLGLEGDEDDDAAAQPKAAAPPSGQEVADLASPLLTPAKADGTAIAPTPAAPPSGQDVAELASSLFSPAKERSRLRYAVARLSARAAALAQLAEAEEVDREAVDEEVHGIDFLLDAARRSLRRPASVDATDASWLRLHAAELAEDVARVRSLDCGDLPAIDTQLQVIATTLRHLHAHVDRGVFRRWAPRPCPADRSPPVVPAKASIPWRLVLAVVIDSIVDGMLIGLAGSVGLTSGWLMAMATAVEMGFLGYSYACSVVKTVPNLKAVATLSLPPLAMMAASGAAFAGASDLEGQPAFVGLIAFALVALLFLVVEELLLEAHEKEGSEAWHISGWLYVGLLLSICLDVAV